ncbi:MAG: PDZ domain-containing protein [Myxococcales bacterium]|nr:PDZ domain-containing protein [Myxococcales bacterium]
MRRRLAVGESVEGFVVRDVELDGLAERAGLERDDVIVTLDGKPFSSPAALHEALSRGEVPVLGVVRRGTRLWVVMRP